MLNKNVQPSSIGGIKRHAKQLKKANEVSHHEALDLAARNASYENFAHARNQIQSLNSTNILDLINVDSVNTKFIIQSLLPDQSFLNTFAGSVTDSLLYIIVEHI